MEKNAGSFVLALYSILAICMIGCGSLEEDAAFMSANPPSGSAILPDSIVTVTFNNTPMTVDVEIQRQRDTSFFWELDGKKLTVRGNPKFQADRNYIIIITWATGRKILNYTVPSPKPPLATFVSANPPRGSKISANSSTIITFSSDPGTVTASVGSVSGGGKTRTILGPFTPGALSLTITWINGDGNYTFNYTVTPPDTTPPKVISGTVEMVRKTLIPKRLTMLEKLRLSSMKL